MRAIKPKPTLTIEIHLPVQSDEGNVVAHGASRVEGLVSRHLHGGEGLEGRGADPPATAVLAIDFRRDVVLADADHGAGREGNIK